MTLKKVLMLQYFFRRDNYKITANLMLFFQFFCIITLVTTKNIN